MGLLVVSFHNREGFHDVVHILPCDTVEVEKGGIEFASEAKAPLRIPRKRPILIAAVVGEGGKVVGGVDQLEDAGEDPVAEGEGVVPGTWFGMKDW